MSDSDAQPAPNTSGTQPISPPPSSPSSPPPPPVPLMDDPVSPHIETTPANANETATRLFAETRTIEWLQFVANAILAVVGIVALCIYQGQLSVMQGQLTEIQKQYPELQKTAEAGRASAEVSELSERPWIKIGDMGTLGNGDLIPALSFNGYGHGPFPNAGHTVTFQTRLTLKNVGHSVADVAIDQELFLPLWDKYLDSILAEQKRYCDQSADHAAELERLPKNIVFPDDPPSEWGAAPAAAVTPEHVDHFGGSANGYILPTVIVCANYRISGSRKLYQTRAIFEVFRRDNRTRFFDVGVNVKARGIDILREPTLRIMPTESLQVS